VALSNAERQRNHKERLKQKAAEGLALADLNMKSQHAFGELITRLERVVFQLEREATAHTHRAGTLSLPSEEVERLAGLKEFWFVDEEGSTKPEPVFLGMSAQQWTTMPRELLEVFGLTGMAAKWRRQANESITDNNEWQPENVDIEEHPAQASSPEGKEDFPFAEITEGSWMPQSRSPLQRLWSSWTSNHSISLIDNGWTIAVRIRRAQWNAGRGRKRTPFHMMEPSGGISLDPRTSLPQVGRYVMLARMGGRLPSLLSRRTATPTQHRS
jgi:hypothetical protein